MYEPSVLNEWADAHCPGLFEGTLSIMQLSIIHHSRMGLGIESIAKWFKCEPSYIEWNLDKALKMLGTDDIVEADKLARAISVNLVNKLRDHLDNADNKQLSSWQSGAITSKMSTPVYQSTYVIGPQHENMVKIGRSKDVRKRLKTISTSYPGTLVCHGYVTIDIEKALHDEFEEHRVNGEWFHIDPKEIIAYMEGKNLVVRTL